MRIDWNQVGAKALIFATWYGASAFITSEADPLDWHWALKLITVIFVIRTSVSDLS